MTDKPAGVLSSSASAALIAASEPWAFTQESPLDSSDFCKEAEKRQIRIREEQLPELWRIGALAPFVEVRDNALHPPAVTSAPEPRSLGTMLAELRAARDAGRLADAQDLGFRPQLHFFRPATMSWSKRWWNGLLYSRWQLLWLYDCRGLLTLGRWRLAGDRLRWRSTDLPEHTAQQAEAARRLAAVLVALEARYLPVVETNWIGLTNAEVEEWHRFAASFDPAAALGRLQVDPDYLLTEADNLLLWLDRIDPLGAEWSELVRRAPRRSWGELSGNALVAMDHRIGAEILLRCYEDLAERGGCAPIEERPDLFHANRQRLSYRSQPLDANLSSLGISPHPGVVLVVEGETEEVLVPLVRDHIKIPDRVDLIQAVVMRGVRRDLTKLAAFASAPLIDRHQAGAWLLAKPPTRLMVVVDPDPPFETPENVEAERQKILQEIMAVVRAQGVDPSLEDLATLVTVTTWTERCFEFAHFSDAELAEALVDLHPDCGGLDRQALESALQQHRDLRQDIKAVWTNWRPRVQKAELARRLWPALRHKLDVAAADPNYPIPPVPGALLDAYHEAARRPRGHFILRGTALSYVEEPTDGN
jgi:hypothetical protein